MANALILHSDLLSRPDVTIAATNAVATMPASKLADPDLKDIFRSSTGSTVIDIDTGAAAAARGLILGGLGDDDLTGLSTFTVAASTVSAGGTDQLAFDATSLTGSQETGFDRLYAHAFADFGATVTARYWRISITAAGAATLDIGRLLIGADLGLSINIGYPLADSFQDLSIADRFASGALAVYPQPMLRRYAITAGIGITDADLYDAIQRTLIAGHGQARQIGFVLDPSDTVRGRQVVIGRITGSGSGSLSGYRKRSRSFDLTEDGGVLATRAAALGL